MQKADIVLEPGSVEIPIPPADDLLAQARAGDVDSFAEICRYYETRLLRHALSLCGDAALAEDLAQDTLVEAWRCLGRYNGRCRFFTWLCAILLNRYRNTLRERRPVPVSALRTADQQRIQDSLGQLVDAAILPDEAAERAERARMLRSCIDTLPVKHQQVVYLRFYLDESLEGIAAALDCSIGTIKSRLFYALNGLRAMEILNPARPFNKNKPDVV